MFQIILLGITIGLGIAYIIVLHTVFTTRAEVSKLRRDLRWESDWNGHRLEEHARTQGIMLDKFLALCNHLGYEVTRNPGGWVVKQRPKDVL